MSRPHHVVLSVGTANGVGKTQAAAAALAASRLAQPTLRITVRKPVQSYDPVPSGPTDAEILASATGEEAEQVCPGHRWLSVEAAPPMAADGLGLPSFTVADLLDELAWPDDPTADLGWVETVGGPRSPMADDGDPVTMAALLDPDQVVVVADAGLGTINATLLAVAPLSHWKTTVLLNRFDPASDLHLRNLGWLREREGLDVVVDIEALAARVLEHL